MDTRITSNAVRSHSAGRPASSCPDVFIVALALIVASLPSCATNDPQAVIGASPRTPPAAPPIEKEAAPEAPPPAKPGEMVAQLREEAKALAPLIESHWVQEFLRATERLPEIAPRTVRFDEAKTHFYSEAEAAALPSAERDALQSRVLDEDYYYTTRYGTPLAYARPLDILASAGFEPARRHILDFGYGGIGQLRLLASLGADVVGVEVDPLDRAL